MELLRTVADGLSCDRPPARAELALYGIYEISKILCGPSSLAEALSGTLQVLHSFLDMTNGVIALLDGQGEPELVVSASLDPAGARRYFAALPERVVGQIVVTEMPVVVENVRRDPSFAACDPGLWEGHASVAFIGVPVRDRDRVIGAMMIDRTWTSAADIRSDEDVRFLKMAANLVGQTVRLHRLVRRDRERLLEDQRRIDKEREDLAAVVRGGAAAGIVGASEVLRLVLDKVRRVARSHSPVLLRGESGTGKELFAHSIHANSPRRAGPFIKLNCAALPESVLESELFGHERGAFTGALAQRKGRFEMADGGTLFLDEIGEISPSFQAKLLRVLQEGEFERVGGNRTLKVNVRIVSATNRNLEDAVAKGGFRADLYYRLSVVPIFLPPLRERSEDIPLLAEAFLRRFNADNGTRLNFAPGTMEVLQACYFPGNVRELENCVRRAATLVRGDTIGEQDFACRTDGCLSSVLWRGNQVATAPMALAPAAVHAPIAAPAGCGGGESACPSAASCEVARPVDSRSEYDQLLEAMEKAGWVQAKAARLLNLTPRQIGYALRKHDIPIKKF
jgi:Nif-specific regulatory protein